MYFLDTQLIFFITLHCKSLAKLPVKHSAINKKKTLLMHVIFTLLHYIEYENYIKLHTRGS